MYSSFKASRAFTIALFLALPPAQSWPSRRRKPIVYVRWQLPSSWGNDSTSVFRLVLILGHVLLFCFLVFFGLGIVISVIIVLVLFLLLR